MKRVILKIFLGPVNLVIPNITSDVLRGAIQMCFKIRLLGSRVVFARAERF